MLPPMMSSFSASSAPTRTLPSASTCAEFPMNAYVEMLKTEMPAFRLTAASPPKPPPTATDVTFSLDAASTVTSPITVTCASCATDASVSFVRTSTSMPAPTAAVPPIVIVPAMPSKVVLSVAETWTAALEPPTTADGST